MPKNSKHLRRNTVSGKQVKEIAEYFGNNGILSSQKKPLSKTSVNAILQNRKYIGEYQYRDVVVPNGNVMAAIEQGIITSTTKKRLAESETLKTDPEVKIVNGEIQMKILTREQVEFRPKNM